MKNTNNTELFERAPVRSALHTMIIPTIAGQLIVLIYNIADTFFIGRTNDPCMVAAASLILPVFNVLIAIANIAGVGGGALVSRLLGAGREDEARRVSSFSLYLSLILSSVFVLLVACFLRPLLTLLGAGSDTIEYARTYALCVIVWGGIPTIMSSTLSNLVRSVGESAKAGIGVTMGGVINIILDPIFMFVLLPDGYEIAGAGIATFLSNCISCIYFTIVLLKLRHSSVLCVLSPRCMPTQVSIRSVFSVGVPAALTMLLFDIDYMVIDKLMSGYSDVALAAVGIVLKAERLPLNTGVGICLGMVPLVAYNLSAGNYKRMNAISSYAFRLGVVFGVISIILYEVFAPYIIRFFIRDAETAALGTRFLRIRSLSTVFMFMCFYHVHLFNGYGEGRYSLALGVIRWAFFNIPLLFILNRCFGMYGIVWTQLCADIVVVIISLAVHKRYKKKKALI